jgi:hypothetical protein
MSKFISLLLATGFSLGLAFAAAGARAADPADHPCKEDVAKFCKGVGAEGGRFRFAACLTQHERELTPACLKHVSEMRAKVKDLRAACHADAVRLCKGEKGARGEMLACLDRHEAEVAPACKAALGQVKRP